MTTLQIISVIVMAMVFLGICIALVTKDPSAVVDGHDIETFTFVKLTDVGEWHINYLFEPGIPTLDNMLQHHASIEIVSARLVFNGYGKDVLDSLSHQQIKELEILIYNQHLESELIIGEYALIPSDERRNYN